MKSKTHPSLLFAAGLTSLAASATSSAADYTWGGGTSTWTDTSATGWNGGPPIAGDTATINGGLVNFAGNDTFGSAGTTTSASIILNGGTLASNGFFTTIWNLNLKGGTLLANGGYSATFPAFQLAGTVTVGGSQASTIVTTTEINAYNQINIGGAGSPTLTFNDADVTGNANPDLTINATLQNSNLSYHFVSAGSQFRAGSGYWVFRGSPNFNVLPPRPSSSKMP